MKERIKTVPRVYDVLNSLRPIRGLEEEWLDRFSKYRGEGVQFLQIGAGDGLRWDPFRRFIIRDHWKGILVEPIPGVFKVLMSNYDYLSERELIFVNAVVTADVNADVVFWTFRDEFLRTLSVEERLLLLQKSSLKRGQVLKALRGMTDKESKIKEIKVPSTTVTSLLERFSQWDRLDLLIVDAEGEDGAIIRSIDFDRIRPRAIFWESHNLADKEALVRLLRSNGYKIMDFAGDSVATVDDVPSE